MELVFATNNMNKLAEVRLLVSEEVRILSLKDIGCHDSIPETNPTLEQNAIQKAQYIYKNFGYNCFADDSGLEIDALDGAPGVYSARYAGEESNADKNINKVLSNLEAVQDRSSVFRTVIALIINGEQFLFCGECNGVITKYRRGNYGFGYDPIFLPNGFYKTFAEMNKDEKGKISHRSIAVNKLIRFIASNF